LAGSILALSLLCNGAPASAATNPNVGYDVGYPQCGGQLPAGAAFGIVGVNNGLPFSANPCLATQFAWAQQSVPQFYMNTANPGTATTIFSWYGQKSPDPACGPSNEAACAFNYGFNAAKHAFEHAQRQTGAAGKWSWWLDVETDNSWSSNTTLNQADLIGSFAFLRSQGVPVGAYSTAYQWGRITGSAQWPDVPVWVAGARNGGQAATWCGADSSFTGGPVTLVQWVESKVIDANHACRDLPVATGPPPTTRAPNALEQLVADLLSGLSRLLAPK